MFSPDDWGAYERSWRSGVPFDERSVPRAQWLARVAADVHRILQNEIETRRFLAEEVYGVPESILDDVIRIRMMDLEEPAES